MIEILEHRGVLHISGPDAGKFLQSMVTNDVLNNIYSYNYLLTNQGRFLFDFFVYQEAKDSYFLDVNRERLLDLQRRLNMYKLRRECELSDVSSKHRIVYSREALKDLCSFSLQDPRYTKLGCRSMVASDAIDQLVGRSEGLYYADKYNYAVIDGDLDLVCDRSIPVEYGAEELHAVDYQKGCYIGQEVISRVKHQGVIRKKVFKLVAKNDISTKDGRAEVRDAEGTKIGTMCSSYKNQAIALLAEEKFLGLKEKIAMIDGQVVAMETPPWREFLEQK